MTPKQFRSAAKYGLRDWILAVHEGTGDEEERQGEVDVVYGRRMAKISITRDFATLPPEEQTSLVLHELTHIHFDRVTSLIHKTLPELIGKPAYHAFIEAYRQEMEHAVDAIAVAIADKYPVWEG